MSVQNFISYTYYNHLRVFFGKQRKKKEIGRGKEKEKRKRRKDSEKKEREPRECASGEDTVA